MFDGPNKIITLEDILSREMEFKVSKDLISCDLTDESVVLNQKNGVYYGLNPVGSFIWKLLQNTRTLKEIAQQVVQEYDVGISRCEQDVAELLEDLAINGLIDFKSKIHN